MFRLVVLLAVLGVVYPKDFIIVNNHGSTVWIGTLGNSDKPAPNNGGFQLDAGQQITVTTDDSWAGRFWARTGCSFDGNGNGHCETGDCGNKLECAGAESTMVARVPAWPSTQTNIAAEEAITREKLATPTVGLSTRRLILNQTALMPTAMPTMIPQAYSIVMTALIGSPSLRLE
ncbi:hypothetical protein C0J52_18972 [Blattella germanica]|nr:hypothetical protein C0J52_18972 [Blattella germanica]